MPKADTEKTTTAARKKTSGGGTAKKSAYNRFMKKELARLKESKPTLAHTERFKLAAKNWATSSDNPKASK
ncbi:hypothetical protein DL96DRAFT_1702601 [Flagelloscypha sp. PMI_526]|nr:hypothetical protein DL96DRAFT_1702601 [Flagelloscypha sp. PMI_526]